MSKPSYLALLNSIAVNEKKGEIFLNAWAEVTPDEELQATLRFVAIREGEHAWAFTKRMCELGYEVSEEDAYQVFKDFDGLMACVCSDASDADKIAYLTGGRGAEEERDPFGGFFKDTTIDPVTGGLLGRYIAEERDSGRRLQEQYARICNGDTAGSPAGGQKTSREMKELRRSIKALRREVKALKRLHAA